MSDPGDKSDDLISELARLMASGASGGEGAVKPVSRPAPLNAETGAPPTVRIPGMTNSAPTPAQSTPTPILTPEPPRGPATGTIRIPGMDQPAPVRTSAPVAKFDFGTMPSAEPIKSDAGPSMAPRVSVTPTPAAPAPSAGSANRIPSQLQPVSENRSFGQGPAPVVVRPKVEPASQGSHASSDSDFNFDFGFGQSSQQKPANDPIADLIAAELADPAPKPDVVKFESRPADAAPSSSPPPQGPAAPPMSQLANAASRSASSPPIPLKPVSSPQRPADSDRFAISPGMGMSARADAGQPQTTPVLTSSSQISGDDDDSDPMAEIESLIGEAVRVELGPGPVKVQSPVEVQSEPAPVVPPLTAQFAPRRAAPIEHEDDAGEDAIRAAALDTGVELGRLDGPVGEESPYRRLKVKPQRSSRMSGGMRQYVGMAVAGTLLLAAGLGLYWVLNMGRSVGTADAPVLTADATPVKVAPTPEVTTTEETPASPVMDQLGGTAPEPSAEQLVPTDETVGQDPLRVVGDTPTAPTPTAESESDGTLANRKVRTVTVRPDGTIVSGDDAVAGAEALPIDRPNVPDVPGSTVEETDLLGDGAFPATDPIASAIDDATTTAAVAAVPDTNSLLEEISAAGGFLDNTKVAPTPAPKPDYAAIASAAPVTETPTPTPLAAFPEATGTTDLLATTPEPVAAAPVSSGTVGAYVQLTSSPSEADANAQVRTQTNRYGSLFGGGSLVVQSANLGQKGTWYRVRLPVSTLSEANRICASIKAAGGDCIATGA